MINVINKDNGSIEEMITIDEAVIRLCGFFGRNKLIDFKQVLMNSTGLETSFFIYELVK